jgi:DNA repair protein RadC
MPYYSSIIVGGNDMKKAFSDSNKGGIKNWPKDERPREKLFKSGEHTLSNTELIAILLRSGIKGQSAIDLSRKILSKFKTFRNMSHTDLRDWEEFKGLGQAKIAQLKAALEIARRFNYQEPDTKKTKINSSEEIVKMFKPRMRDLKNEVFKVILCSAKNGIIGTVEIAQGSPSESYPLTGEIISKALQNFASGIVCIHNHPSGEPTPSREDEIFTSKLRELCKSVGIRLLDHIIFGEDQYYSFDTRTAGKYSEIC